MVCSIPTDSVGEQSPEWGTRAGRAGSASTSLNDGVRPEPRSLAFSRPTGSRLAHAGSICIGITAAPEFESVQVVSPPLHHFPAIRASVIFFSFFFHDTEKNENPSEHSRDGGGPDNFETSAMSTPEKSSEFLTNFVDSQQFTPHSCRVG
jgi:hypothetical protein